MVVADAMDAWRALVEKTGTSIESLRFTTEDGIVLDPLHGAAEPVFAGRGTGRDWTLVQRVDADGAAGQAREDLENGATALALVFAGAPSAHGRGLTADSLESLDSALDGVRLDWVPLHLEAGSRARAAFAMVAVLAERRRTPPAALHAGIDPLGTFAATGRTAAWREVVPRLADAVRTWRAMGVPGTALLADGRPLAESGATAVQELAFALAALAAMVRALDEAGLPPDETIPATAMALSASADQFATIAKLRAARRLHALFADACGAPGPLTLHAGTAARMLSRSDPHTNLLRLTIAAFGAGVGGADAVTVLPFDAAASPFARRMARNIQTLLLEEAHVGELNDPAAGAGAVEAYTDRLAEEAWTLFQAHERDGLVNRIADGSIAAAVNAAAEARSAALRDGSAAIIGVTRHPPASPARPARPAAVPSAAPSTRRGRAPDGDSLAALKAAALAGATLADLAAADEDDEPPVAPALRPRRDGAPFED